MNKKGFTLIELIFVVLLLAIISAITIPGIMQIKKHNDEQKYIDYEKILIENMKIYNIDNEDILWSDNSEVSLTYEILKGINSDINLNDGTEVCTPTTLKIQKIGNSYNYLVCMLCTDSTNQTSVSFYGSGCN